MATAVEILNVRAGYRGEVVLRDVSCSIPIGIIQIIVGPSGAGKTSLLRLINGLLKPRKGKVRVLECSTPSVVSSNKEVGYIPQNLGLIGNMSVFDNVLMGALARVRSLPAILKIYPEEEKKFANKLISKVGLSLRKDKKVEELSGGEKRRVAIARAFMQKPKILLADEILSDLDFVLVKQITEQLKRLQKEFTTTVIMVEHDLKIARSIGDKIMILRDGNVRGNYIPKNVTDKIFESAFK